MKSRRSAARSTRPRRLGAVELGQPGLRLLVRRHSTRRPKRRTPGAMSEPVSGLSITLIVRNLDPTVSEMSPSNRRSAVSKAGRPSPVETGDGPGGGPGAERHPRLVVIALGLKELSVAPAPDGQTAGRRAERVGGHRLHGLGRRNCIKSLAWNSPCQNGQQSDESMFWIRAGERASSVAGSTPNHIDPSKGTTLLTSALTSEKKSSTVAVRTPERWIAATSRRPAAVVVMAQTLAREAFERTPSLGGGRPPETPEAWDTGRTSGGRRW